ncbi:MAG: efflux RND transporter permease subunit [Pseudomonadales bacterium]|nr:efflux RND transporter permease subunit [Pseudomonadales bacterium]
MLMAGGVLMFFKLPVSLFPQVAFPRIAVSLDAGDRPAELMLLQITQPVEEKLRQLPGVREVRSTTSRGSAEISVNFDWGRPMDTAALQVSSALAEMLPQLPLGTDIHSYRMDPTRFPILAYSLRSNHLDLSQLRDIAQLQLLPLLSGIDGVARIEIQGGAVSEFQVSIDPWRAQALQLSNTDIEQALAQHNILKAAGRMEDHYKLYLTVVDGQLHNIADLNQIILRSDEHGMVRLGDVGHISIGMAPSWQRVNADGQDAVLVLIYQQPDGNSVSISKEVNHTLQHYQSQLPPDVRLASWYNQSQLVAGAAASVRDAIFLGIFLASLVLLVFLRHVRIMLIAILVVPTVLSTTLLLLGVLGMSLNIMTLGGMAASVGLIIDDAIVMVEQLLRRLQTGTGPHHQRIMAAAIEFLPPLAGSSAATLVIFLPLAFLSGVTGAFFKALALTMSISLLMSFLISWLVLPLLADYFLRSDTSEPPVSRLGHFINAQYSTALSWLIRHPLWLMLGILPMLGVGWAGYQHVGSGFMPSMDEGGFTLDYRTPPGTSLTETDRLVRQIEAIIRANPNVASYSRRTGAQLGGWLTEANEGDIFVRLRNGPRAGVNTVMDELRQQISTTIPGIETEMSQLMEDLIGDLTAVPQPIEVKIYGDDPKVLASLAHQVTARLRSIPGIVDVRDGINPSGDALNVVVDPTRAALAGLTPDAIYQQIHTALGGDVVSQIPVGPRMWNVRVWMNRALTDSDVHLAKFLLHTPQGYWIPLDKVAVLQADQGQAQINRDNLKRMLAVTARISGRDMGSALVDVQHRLKMPGLWPRAYYFQLGGLYAQQQLAFHGLLLVMAAAVALVFGLLLFLYENFTVALCMLSTPLLAMSAVFTGLWLSGTELNISSMMGMTMVVGIVTEVGIFYFSEFTSLPETQTLELRLVQAGVQRLRPITMTTLTAILTLLPLAMAWGEGSAMQQPLAIAIISGLLVQLPLALLVMPALYHLIRSRSHDTVAR